MPLDGSESLLLEVLRIGLISIRNFSESTHKNSLARVMLLEWSILCHSLPSILIGECSEAALIYFLKGDAESFLKGYPRRDDADYLQVAELIDEIRRKVVEGS